MKKKKLLSSLLVLSICATVVLTGCASKVAKSDRPEDELVLAVIEEPENGLDPTAGWGHGSYSIFHSNLFVRDENNNVANDLATGYTISDDKLTWTIKIRNDAKWTDGQPVTAKDVAFTYNKAKTSGSNIDLTMLETVTPMDDSSIEFKINRPQSTFINRLIGVGIVPEHAYSESYAQNPIGSGPYKFLQWDKGQQIIAERNDGFYGEKPYFKKLSLLFLSEEAALAAAQSGEVDIAKLSISYAKQKPAGGMKIQEVDSMENSGIVYPMAKGGELTADKKSKGNDVTSDIAIRKALNIAIDREDLVEGVLEGFGSPAITGLEGLPWNNTEITIPDGDSEAAKKLLAEAGWAANSEGILVKNGIEAKFDCYYRTGNEYRQALAVAVADVAKSLGIEINLIGASWDEIEQKQYANAVLFSWGEADPTLVQHLWSTDFAGVDFFNTGFYSNPTVDAYINAAVDAKTEEEALADWKKAQWDGKTGFAYLGDASWTWIANMNHLYLMDEDLSIGTPRVQPHGGAILENITEWTRTQ